MKIKLDKADQIFGKYIRLRDGKCMRCGKWAEENQDGDRIVGIECSHFYGRAKKSVRFDPENCDALCTGCHQYWGSTDTEAYRTFKIKQLGEEGFEKLTIRANMPVRDDRKLAYIVAKKLYEQEKNKISIR